MNQINVTANYTVVVPESPNNVVNQGIILNCDSTSGAIAITVPPISTFGNSPKFTIVVNDAAGTSATNPITVNVDSGDKVNNALTTVLNQTGKALTMNIVGTNDWDSIIAGGGLAVVAVTSTTDGLTTGLIPNGNVHVQVTSSSASNFVTLPAPVVGTSININVGANGFKLRSNSPTTVAINGGTGSAVSSTIAANFLVRVYCNSATTWIATSYAAAGTVTATAPAA